MSHHCHATDCPYTVPPSMFMCRTHWFSLPKPLRAAIWATYRPGQEDDKHPSDAYCRAAKACVEYVAQQEGRTPDTQLYDFYLRDAPPS